MLLLKGDTIFLRALEPTDLDFLYHLENNPDVWEISGTTSPFSKFVLKEYLENAHRDIYEVKQLRLCICNLNEEVLGLVDLFDFDPKNKRVGLGIIVLNTIDRNKGVGGQVIGLICDYAYKVLDVKQLYVNVLEENEISLHLFKKMGFQVVGVKEDWIYSNGKYKNEVLLQKIKDNVH
ncbi:GNAT family N-acetyltransferase [Euzebyella saccharophila]|uniref:GNAT family N-acetyltransferase n=1 Tax=Euzebyella saccharophila TaxID=679664 RepID=A0ABV8JVX3_9FLAO|nr:GNAT family protein [Euzebyella saccharophila]